MTCSALRHALVNQAMTLGDAKTASATTCWHPNGDPRPRDSAGVLALRLQDTADTRTERPAPHHRQPILIRSVSAQHRPFPSTTPNRLSVLSEHRKPTKLIGIPNRSASNLARHRALPNARSRWNQLTPRVRCPSLRNPHGGPSVRSAQAGPRNDSTIASMMYAHRTQMTGWSNVVRAAISGVLPTF
jgi:hypothetical protein